MEISQLRQLAETGLSDRDMGRIFGRSTVRIRQLRQENDIPAYGWCRECRQTFPLKGKQNRTVSLCPSCLVDMAELSLATPLPLSEFARYCRTHPDTLRSVAMEHFGVTRKDLTPEQRVALLNQITERRAIGDRSRETAEGATSTH
ncbi:hypothetical protein [Nitrolancea hollandica]|uniref:Uncharacterized protein n=1 Tax=Nitrolancea hollandica Lb TaxID=1129897 RepID=I4EFK4_9BACT|nr:hypothetical protein [Nitrolancea hollandica]CCF83466.1 hypothetical protein NITHO_2310009 [Nitrolancea hollandica Lb]